MEYRVTWIIDIDAESFEEAARLARKIQLDPDSLASYFVVACEDGTTEEIDLYKEGK
jgi:hypothetical protein